MRRLAAVMLLSMIAATPTSQPSSTIVQLVTQLSSDDYHERQSAADKLVDQGDAIRPQIEKLAADSSDAERRNLAAGILSRLDRLNREGPTYITLHAHDADPQKVLAELADQAKVSIHFSANALRNNRLPTVTLDVDHKLFWLTLADLCRLTRTHVQIAEGASAIELGTGHDNDAMDGPTCIAGPFVIAAVTATHNSQVRYGDPAHGVVANTSIEFALYTDPRAHPIDSPIPRIDEAIDENGHSLLPPNRQHSGSSGNRGRWMRSFNSELVLRPDSHRLKRLHGTIDVTFAVDSTTLDIPDVQAGLHKIARTGDVSVEPTACRFSPHDGSYTLAFRRVAPGPLNLQGLKLIDATGVVLFEGKGTVVITTADAFSLSGAFNRPVEIKQPVSLQWTVPTRTETRHEPFEFDDLPLP